MSTTHAAHLPSVSASKTSSLLRRVLLGCGIAAALLYVVMNVVTPLLSPEYDVASRTVSELSAIGAPTRPLWVALAIVDSFLVAGFGAGIWASARGSRSLRGAGALMIAGAVIGLAWPPMHQREVLAAGGGTLTDTLHIGFTMIWAVITLLAMGLSAAALGKGFRVYAAATMVVLLVTGFVTGLDGPRVSANLPTPWIGVWERITTGAYTLWLAVLAIALLRREKARDP